MGRRSDHTLEQIKDMAISAAEKIVRKKGLDELSTRKIASEIGYTSGTLYLVFDNLDDLLMHVNGRSLTRLRDALTEVAANTSDPADLAKALCRCYLKFADENRVFWSLIFEKHWAEGSKRPLWYQSLVAQCFAPMVAALKGASGGKRTELEIQKAALGIWAMVHGTFALYASGRAESSGISSVPDLVDYQLDLYIRGFLAAGNSRDENPKGA